MEDDDDLFELEREDYGEDIGDEYEDEPHYEEQKFVHGYDDFQRAGRERAVPGLMVEGQLEKMNKRVQRASMTPEDNFAMALEKQFTRFKENGIYALNEQDWLNLFGSFGRIKHIGDKNPIAYIFGYIVSKGGYKVDKQMFNKVVKDVLPKLAKDPGQGPVTYEGIAPEDILRYARYWNLHLKP